jgi:aspartokinase-like uncharacterized kinase
VIKVGGSLFDCDDLPESLCRWLENQSPAHQVLLAGGGPLTEFIREADRRFHLPASTSHWLCVDLMETSGDLLAGLLPSAVRIDRFDRLQVRLAAAVAEPIVFTAAQLLRDCESQLAGPALARDWRTTSDAIAARVARAVGAQELVLLKSCPLPHQADLRSAARQGLVDAEFPTAAAGLPVRWVDFRERPPGQGRTVERG